MVFIWLKKKIKYSEQYSFVLASGEMENTVTGWVPATKYYTDWGYEPCNPTDIPAIQEFVRRNPSEFPSVRLDSLGVHSIVDLPMP